MGHVTASSGVRQDRTWIPWTAGKLVRSAAGRCHGFIPQPTVVRDVLDIRERRNWSGSVKERMSFGLAPWSNHPSTTPPRTPAGSRPVSGGGEAWWGSSVQPTRAWPPFCPPPLLLPPFFSGCSGCVWCVWAVGLFFGVLRGDGGGTATEDFLWGCWDAARTDCRWNGVVYQHTDAAQCANGRSGWTVEPGHQRSTPPPGRPANKAREGAL